MSEVRPIILTVPFSPFVESSPGIFIVICSMVPGLFTKKIYIYINDQYATLFVVFLNIIYLLFEVKIWILHLTKFKKKV